MSKGFMHLWDEVGRRNRSPRAITESSPFIPLLRKQTGPAPQSDQSIRQWKRRLEGFSDEAFRALRDIEKAFTPGVHRYQDETHATNACGSYARQISPSESNDYIRDCGRREKVLVGS